MIKQINHIISLYIFLFMACTCISDKVTDNNTLDDIMKISKQ